MPAHRLRHALASDLLREGVSMINIGQVLRHEHLESTAIYAKVDLQRAAARRLAVAGSDPMTTFADHVDDYLRLRRGIGFKLEEHARLLPKFAAHLDAVGAEVVTTELAVEPVVPAGSVVPAMRLVVVRGFARYLAGIDPGPRSRRPG